jgi:hypothetical protein
VNAEYFAGPKVTYHIMQNDDDVLVATNVEVIDPGTDKVLADTLIINKVTVLGGQEAPVARAGASSWERRPKPLDYFKATCWSASTTARLSA